MDPFLLDGATLLNVSGGRTSGLMLRRYLDANGGALPPDTHAVFCNTGVERRETLDFIDEIARRWDVSIRWLERDGRAPAGRRFREVTYETAARNGEPFEELITERSFLPNAVMRFCTSELKVNVARDFMRSQGHTHWTSALGLRADESRRVSNVRAKAGDEWDVSCPLHDAHITNTGVLAFWGAQSFDLKLKSYEGNCTLCFQKGRTKRERIMREREDLAEWWIRQEQRIGGRFCAHEPTYAATLDRVRRLPLLPMDLDADGCMGGYCTDRRAPRRCVCNKRRGQGHTVVCVMSRRGLLGDPRPPIEERRAV